MEQVAKILEEEIEYHHCHWSFADVRKPAWDGSSQHIPWTSKILRCNMVVFIDPLVLQTLDCLMFESVWFFVWTTWSYARVNPQAMSQSRCRMNRMLPCVCIRWPMAQCDMAGPVATWSFCCTRKVVSWFPRYDLYIFSHATRIWDLSQIRLELRVGKSYLHLNLLEIRSGFHFQLKGLDGPTGWFQHVLFWFLLWQ